MGGFVVKQPNGLYCRFSTTCECPSAWNMTENDYIEYCKNRAVKQAEEDAKITLKHYLLPFEEIKKQFSTLNMSQEEFDKILKEMGE